MPKKSTKKKAPKKSSDHLSQGIVIDDTVPSAQVIINKPEVSAGRALTAEEIKSMSFSITEQFSPENSAEDIKNVINLAIHNLSIETKYLDDLPPSPLRKREERQGHMEDDDQEQGLTARGTERKYKKPRPRGTFSADNPRTDKDRDDVKLGGRIPRNLRDRFVNALDAKGTNQSAALTELVEGWLELNEPE